MITLNEIAYNIKNLAYGGEASIENSISLRQIKHWIHYHRAKLIADNIDKGITNNEAIYQKMAITARNSTDSSIKKFYDEWDAYDIDSSLDPPSGSAELITNYPKFSTVNKLNGEWLAHSSLSIGGQGWSDNQSRSFYGDEISKSQVKGDFRNFGSHDFWTPRPLQLKNDQGIKSVDITRFVHFSDDPSTAETNEQANSYGKKSIKLYRKEYNNFDEYNKFTNHSKPYYIQETSKIDRNDGYGNYNYISFRGLQVSPNYHGGLKSPANKKVFWKYAGGATMILENPTEIDMMWSWWYENEMKWDDNTTPYPIPMEYVSDLIQRVIQIETQTELKTASPSIDDNLKRKNSGI